MSNLGTNLTFFLKHGFSESGLKFCAKNSAVGGVLKFSILMVTFISFGCAPSSDGRNHLSPQPYNEPTIGSDNKPSVSSPAPAPDAQEKKPLEKPSSQEEKAKSEEPRKDQETSKFIKNAAWVMTYEGKKLGTPCNFYLRRVLEVSGFPSKGFVANDFDLYAKNFFNSYKSRDYVNDVKGTDHINLKNDIWSYPERTPFILQWTGVNMPGHLAILERQRDKLIIYHASLHRFTARRETTSVNNLLSGFNGRILTVYSEFK